MERKRRNSLIVLSVTLLLVAITLGMGGARIRAATPKDAARSRWLDYATSVERGERQPSAEVARALTDAVISQDEAVDLAGEVLQWAGFIVGALAVFQIAVLTAGRRTTSQHEFGDDASRLRDGYARRNARGT
jgi:hypothetical protein